ncbi:PAS domain-containing protein [Anaeromyxobacter diazotrophicus]|uniref:Histidine kinase domain-containing protein n=1 Tax=Anaeromyxobacter diazotrophicus TaxID=2590199 RepID=A0A7I9VRH3_9BACT|nr:PAS domain-containing protein [Anaeromyxobacter diazotrophicus]GEJ58547.1 hypothetical protein AMYX_32880 [Anaeromyxobacter diazotrophicus]
MQAAAAHPDSYPYDLAFASLPEPTLLVDEGGSLTGMNGAAEALLGPAAVASAEAGEPLARALPWLAPAAADVLGGAPEAALEAEVRTGGGRRCLSARLRRVSGPGGALRGAVVVLEDLTERRALDARLRAAEQLAALGTLAAGIAHEVNSPLACVVAGLSFVEAEHERLGPAVAEADLVEARAALEEARAAALRVGRIVRSLQVFGRPTAPLLGEVELARAIRDAALLAEPALRGRARLALSLAEGIAVRASEAALTELFLGIVAHAAQSLPAAAGGEEGTLRVGLEVRGGEARVEVAAEGAGARPLAAPEPAAERPDLGLLVCHGLASALGGSVAVGTGEGGGVTALVRLPLA